MTVQDDQNRDQDHDQDHDNENGQDRPEWDQNEAEDHAPQDETARLDLDEEERLPWLESDDYDGEYAGTDNGRIVGFVLLGLVALAAIVGGVWWATHRTLDPNLVADGSTIEAPAQPYKEAPKNPGGKTFEGTGDSSFAVSEGQNRPARLGQQGAAPVSAARPGIDLAGKTAGSASGPAGASGGIGVQVGAFSTQATAEAGWSKLSQQYSALSGLHHRVVEGKADIGTVYRLQAMAGDGAGAHALCGKLRSAGLACQVKD